MAQPMDPVRSAWDVRQLRKRFEPQRGDGRELALRLLVLSLLLPLLGPALLLGLLGLAVHRWAQAISGRAPGHARPHESALRVVRDRLEEGQADLDAEHFLERVRRAVERFAEAWSRQQPGPVAPFVSDGLHEQLRLRFDEQRALGLREEPLDLVVERIGIARVRSEGRFDVLAVGLDVAGHWVQYSLASGAELGRRPAGEAGLSGFWTFIRRRGAKSRSGPGLIEGCCPNCSAPIELVRHARCPACSAWLRSGQHDWVLAEITDPRSWKPRPSCRAPGVAAYRERDPELSVQHLEDRAAVLFWRQRAAERVGGLGPLRRALGAELGERLGACVARDGRELRLRARVLDVETLAVAQGEVWDRAAVAVDWSAELHRVGADGAIGPSLGPCRGRELFLLARRAGLLTPDGLDVSSAHCSSCGAPDDAGSELGCRYCGAARDGGSGDWLLAGLYDLATPEARAALAEVGAPR